MVSLNLYYILMPKSRIEGKIKEKLPGVRSGESLAPHTNFEIGGKASYFWEAKKEEEIIRAVKLCRRLNLPYYILGGGSNVLVSDAGFAGMVIKIATRNFVFRKNKIVSEAGVKLGDLVKISLENDCAGLENFWGIPGTVGGALYGNAGAFGKWIGEVITKVKVLNPKNLQIEYYSQKECQFDYRISIFKNEPRIILAVALNLQKVKDKKALREKIKKICAVRAKHPVRGCAGSVFKNIPLGDLRNPEIRKLIPLECAQFGEIKVACLISQLGLKGKRKGGAEISKKHTNFIVNRGGAFADDVLNLIDLVRKKVYEKYRIVLETEIQFVGFKRKA